MTKDVLHALSRAISALCALLYLLLSYICKGWEKLCLFLQRAFKAIFTRKQLYYSSSSSSSSSNSSGSSGSSGHNDIINDFTNIDLFQKNIDFEQIYRAFFVKEVFFPHFSFLNFGFNLDIQNNNRSQDSAQNPAPSVELDPEGLYRLLEQEDEPEKEKLGLDLNLTMDSLADGITERDSAYECQHMVVPGILFDNVILQNTAKEYEEAYKIQLEENKEKVEKAQMQAASILACDAMCSTSHDINEVMDINADIEIIQEAALSLGVEEIFCTGLIMGLV